MSVIAELASFVSGAKASALPAEEQTRLRLHLADTAVAALAGSHIPEGKALQTLPGDGALAGRIGRQAAAIRLTEIDDIHLPSCTTPSSCVVPVALALAAHSQNDEPDTIANAIWVGTEIACRIGLAVNGPQVLYRGIWPTYLAAPVAAAATAARILGLDETRTSHAMSLACMQMAGGVGRIHGTPSGRWFLFGNAIAGGIAAAEAAAADYRGDPDLLDGNWFLDTHGVALDRERLRPEPGHSVDTMLSQKPFCSAKQGIAAIEAFRAIIGTGVRADDVTQVRVRVPGAYSGMISARAVPGARQSTLVSAAYQIALAALAPERLSDVDRSVPLNNPAIMEFAAKVAIVPDETLGAFYPQHWPAEVEVDAAGKTVRQRVVEATGDPEHRLDRAAIDDKARRVLDPLVGRKTADAWLQTCHAALDDNAACRKLADAFAEGF
jgi:2-methylcitrate dehydratase PrpD